MNSNAFTNSAPGNDRYYGTNGAGELGFHDASGLSGGGGGLAISNGGSVTRTVSAVGTNNPGEVLTALPSGVTQILVQIKGFWSSASNPGNGNVTTEAIIDIDSGKTTIDAYGSVEQSNGNTPKITVDVSGGNLNLSRQNLNTDSSPVYNVVIDRYYMQPLSSDPQSSKGVSAAMTGTSLVVTDPNVLPTSVITWTAQSNANGFIEIVPGTGSFTINSSVAESGLIFNYVITN